MTWPKEGAPGLILFSNPAHENECKRMTLRGSHDDCATWPIELVLYEGASAYSCLVALPSSEAGCLFEADGYKRIVFARVPLDRFRAQQ